MFELYAKYKDRINIRAFKISKRFVIGINLILLIILSVSYSKKNRVEAMYYLYKQPDVKTVMIEDGNKEDDFTMPPLFYFGKWFSVIGITKQFNADSALFYYNRNPDSQKANYVVFWQAEHLDERVNEFKKRFPGTEYVTTIEPSLIDKTLHWMNPFGNDNQTTYIYKIPEATKK